MEALPPQFRNLSTLMGHPVLVALQCLPRAIWRTAPLLRQGACMLNEEACTIHTRIRTSMHRAYGPLI